MPDEFRKEDFGRRAYYIDGEIDKVELIVKVNGKQHSHLHFMEPGLLAIVSKVGENGLWIEHVQPGGPRYTDVLTPEAVRDQAPRDWQYEALGVK